MSKQTSKNIKNLKDKSPQAATSREKSVGGSTKHFDRKTLLSLLFILVLTVIIYIPAINNGFTNWDDQEYVTNNKEIQKLDFEQVKHFFSSFKMGNYHPLTMLSYAVEYKLSKLNPRIYHIDNLLFHL